MQEDSNVKTLDDAQLGEECIIKAIDSDDEELKNFLFTLGCYPGEPIVVVTRKKENLVVSIKDGRYSIDNELAKAVII